MHDWTASLEPGRVSHLCIIAWPVKLALHRRFRPFGAGSPQRSKSSRAESQRLKFSDDSEACLSSLLIIIIDQLRFLVQRQKTDSRIL